MIQLKSLAIAAVAALGITTAPMPAQADSSDVAKVLGGLAVLGIIAKVANDRRDRDREAAARARVEDPLFDLRRVDRFSDEGFTRFDNTKRKRGRGVRKLALPDRCLRIAETHGRDRLVYGERCLNRHYKHARHLPDACRLVIRTDRGLRAVYANRCLRRDGWRVARR